MINYFIYRINVNYDGFYPSGIPARRSGNNLLFNWAAYLEALDIGDLVLVYFFGGNSKKGVYALARINRLDLSKNENNVKASLIKFSSDDQEPLIPYENNRDYFDPLFRLRRRGSEISVPSDFENLTYDLLRKSDNILSRCCQLGLILPGSPEFPKFKITQVRLADLEKDVSKNIKEKGIISAYLIRPRQASWILRSPDYVQDITLAFNAFKKGDMSLISVFADALETQLRRNRGNNRSKLSFITAVPLCQHKAKAGETDRVANLAKALALRLGVPYEPLFYLKGRVSRRLYKSLGYSTEKFINDYQQNLLIRRSGMIRELAVSNREMLLVDDVYTDGITTSTIINVCRRILGCENIKVRVVTLGLMIKKGNIGALLMRRFSNEN